MLAWVLPIILLNLIELLPQEIAETIEDLPFLISSQQLKDRLNIFESLTIFISEFTYHQYVYEPID
jgi:hypothetical protein